MSTLALETAADFIAAGYKLTGHCAACGRMAPVDLGAVPSAAVLVGARRAPLRCGACGSAETSRTVVAPTWWSR